MRLVAAASLALASLAAGQSLADLPDCSLPCINEAVRQGTACSATDLACVCDQFDAIQGAAAGCILQACGQDIALNQVLPDTEKLCAQAGGSSSSSAGKSRPTPTKRPGQSASVATVPPPAMTAEPSSTGAPTAPPVVTAGAAVLVPVGGLAMLAAAAALAL
ncbi:Extracellular membrane protein, CFEM domain protein [Metarhizium album ARSEF 1941]|uniref:Extracellular membrane protein, CFEM domain protein n=1 Tax=Metarhizium album (strain ARSEF 1941) TaxID=1081103 RepID=A0A0B2WLQ6_METAS|nr:Extracellular membrane protein, CFEM domain protein [Metarhizium album ARSEF 1941]KHN93950.1 Extracellular membrane protein, CFEM domain protein [Metarhizium album ARSEF 1941]